MIETSNPSQPIWLRIKQKDGKRGESARAYEAANAYFKMGSERSISKVIQKWSESSPKPPAISCLKRWSRRWNWVERAQSYDDHCFEERERELQKARAEEAKKWLERDSDLRERFFRAGEEILKKAERMIQDYPEREVTKTTSDDEKTIYITVRPKASLSGLAQLLSVGAELQRLAVGINPGSSPLDKMDFTQFASEDLQALSEGRPIKPLEKKDAFAVSRS
jgi:hypothetical protein